MSIYSGPIYGVTDPMIKNLDASSNRITNLGDPVDNGDAANKLFVQSEIAGENHWDSSGNNLIPYVVGRNIILSTGDVGSTAVRITKGWFTDVEVTNMPTVSGTSINANGALSLTSGEVTQLTNIDSTTISTTQWGYLGLMNQGIATTDSLQLAGLTLTSFSGVLQATAGVLSASATLTDGTLATTQSVGDNTTKVATTAFVTAAVGGEDHWDRVTGGTNYLIPNTTADDI